jgi:transcriptional regulator EpsA
VGAAAPDQLLILSGADQECLLRVIEAAVQVRDLSQLFLLTQGQLQSLLPHAVMVAMRFDAGGALQRLECLNSNVLDATAIAHLCDRDAGLAVRAARHWSATGLGQPAMTGPTPALRHGALAGFQAELGAHGHGNVLLHGSGALAGGASVFALFGLPGGPGPHHAYFIELLLPVLHLALQRLGEVDAGDGAARPLASIARALSLREGEILALVREGKSNFEVGCTLGISAMTVKNHLQRIYKTLGVNNRTHALSRCLALGLLDELPS